jgi:hypothetical protein
VVVAGLVGVAAGIGFVSWRSMSWTLDGRRELALAVVGPATIAACALALLLGGPLAALTVPTTATLIGFALAFIFHGGGGASGPDDDPPWWPSFERDLRRYERRRSPARRR